MTLDYMSQFLRKVGKGYEKEKEKGKEYVYYEKKDGEKAGGWVTHV